MVGKEKILICAFTDASYFEPGAAKIFLEKLSNIKNCCFILLQGFSHALGMIT